MKINKRKPIYSFKNLLLFLISIGVLFIYLLYIKENIEIDDKWISIYEIQEGEAIESLDSAYLYCNSYDNIKEEKYTTTGLIFSLCCIVISLLILIVLLCNSKKESNKKTNISTSYKQEKTNEIVSKFSNDEQELKVQQILNNDFKSSIYNLFCNLQLACMNSDYKTLQNLLTSELYNKYCTGLATLKLKSRKNIVDDFEFVSAKFIDTNEDNYKYSVKIYLKVKYYGYIIDTKSNEIIKGTKENKIINTYMLKLVKYKNINNCPNCYAPLQNNSTQCEYCKMKINRKTNEWLIDEKEKVNEN